MSSLNRKVDDDNGSLIDFNDSRIAFKSKTMVELLRARVVFTTCQFQTLVANAGSLVNTSYKVLGKGVTNAIMRYSFFGHFCAGEDELKIKPTVDYLQRNGIGSILDYAAESDVAEIPKAVDNKETQCRVYDYRDEELCDYHAITFKKCIHAVKSVSPTGFAAIKCTALGNPKLLERMSITIFELRKLFSTFDNKHTGFVSRDDFKITFEKIFVGAEAEEIFDQIDVNHDGMIDYIEWSNSLIIEDLGRLLVYCREQGPLYKAALDDTEIKLVKKMRDRINNLAKLAKDLGVRLMIDAEHSYFQPAIDNITIDLAKKFNTDYPVIFSTYQMYLKDARNRLRTDILRAKAGNYKFAAKLVRGAYMVVERARARELYLEDPIIDTLEHTHENYDSAIEEIIEEISKSQNRNDIEVMIASHNQKSVELAIENMSKYGLQPDSGVYFGQLLGMSDHLTFSLGNGGYKAYKYVPYGKVSEVMPYLIRRAQENSGLMSNSKNELKMVTTEIRRRLFIYNNM